MTVLEKKHDNKVKNNNEVVISLKNVGKKYIVHHEKPTLAEDIGRVLRLEKKKEYWALKDLSLEVKKGEKIGFYGPNGAGKTTLLKLIAGISYPTEGKIKTKGRIVSLIDLGAGFHPDLTGQENIFLNGLVIGMSQQEIEEKFQSIIDFADIGDFITAPLYTYSAGMSLRLGFSIAIHANPDILLLDEVMNVGDAAFKAKCAIEMNKMFDKGVTIVMVSQMLDYLKHSTDKIFELRT